MSLTETDNQGRGFILMTFYRSLMRKKLKFIAYIIVSICCALLLTFTFGQNYDGKTQKIRGAQKRPVRQAGESVTSNLKDPFANRPRIQTRNGHLVIEASPDKNIDFKTSGSRGTITINGHRLEQLLDVTKALERSVLRNRNMPPDGDGGGLFVGGGISTGDISPASNQFELVLRKLLDSSDALAKFDKRLVGMQKQIRDLSKQMSRASKRLAGFRDTLKKLDEKQEATELKLKRNDCFNIENGKPVCKNGATCIDSYDGFKCLCTPQYDGSTCEDDVDECSKFRGTDLGCQNGAKCVNFAGGYTCECPPQYHGIHCTEQHDDCSLSTSRALCGHGKCINLARNVPNQARYECACDQGWTTDGNNPACVIDINECMVGQATSINSTSMQVSAAWSNSLMAAYPCSQNPFVECINLLGSFECGPCPPGYTGNGRVCRDINECMTNNGGCSMSPLVECINTQGSFRCGPCPPGYTGDGVQCSRISPCDIEVNGGCHPMAKCVELNGLSMSSRFCICNYPLVGDGLGPTGCAISPNLPGPTYGGGGELPSSRNGNDSVVRQQQPQQDDCNPNPCLNDSKCQKTDTSFECICSSGWSGKICDEIGSVCGGKYFVSKGSLTFPKGGSFAELIKGVASENIGKTEIPSKPTDTNTSKHYNCRWSISVSPSSMSIILTLSNLIKLNNSRNPVQYWLANSTSGHQVQVPTCTEYLDIREILDIADRKQNRGNRKLLAKICLDGHGGNLVSLPKWGPRELTLLSESNNAELEYSFSPTRTQFGEPSLSFTLNWTKTEPPCGGSLDAADFGSISSPKFPEFYQAGTECRYLIHVPNDKRIRVQFGELNLLKGRHQAVLETEGYNPDPILNERTSCADSLTILDGSFGNNRPVLFKHCANNVTLANSMQNLAPIISSGSTIELILDSQPDSTEPLMRPKQKRGFYLTYASEPTNPGCGGLYTVKSAIIKSTDYEADLSETAPGEDQRQIVQLFHYFENVNTSSNSSLSSYRSSLDNYSPTSMYTRAANSSEKFTGYKQTYKVRCEYEIRPPNLRRNHKISIDWLEMPRRLPMNSNSLTLWSRKTRCARNRLIVYDGNPLDNSNRTELATFCAGDKYNASLPLLAPIISTGRMLILVYETTNDPFALSRDAQILADAVGSNYPTGFKLRYSTVCTAIYDQNSESIPVRIDDEVSECIYHIVLPPGNTISLRIYQDAIEMPRLADGSCAAQAIFMDGAIQGGKMALIGAERKLKTYSYDPKILDGLKVSSNIETRTGSDMDYVDSTTTTHTNTTNAYWQYSNSGQAHDIKEFDVCSLSDLNIDSVWNHLSLLFRLKQVTDKTNNGETSTTPTRDRLSSKSGKIRLTVSYYAKASCGGIIDQPNEGSIELRSQHQILVYPKRSKSRSSTGQKFQNYFVNCSWVLKAPRNQQIQLRFNVPSKDIKKRFDDWLSWSNKQPTRSKSTKVDADDDVPKLASTFNCAQVYEEVLELYESSLNRTRYICPNELNVMAMADNKGVLNQQQSFWSTQSNIVYIRLRNSSEVYPPLTASNIWPGRMAMNESVITLNYKFVSGSSRQCGGRLIQDSGVITSPMYPYNYPSNANCVWIIQANPSQQIRLNFSKFEIEKQGACSFDFLELRNGPSSDSPLIGRFCNQNLQHRVIVSHSNFMWLKFKSDTSLNRPGFELYFDGAQSGCGGKLTSASGQIDSPNYPLPFAHSSDCKWTIEVVESSKIELTIQDLDLSSDSRDCRINGTKTSYLEIFDSPLVSEKSLGRYCHKNQFNKTTIISSTNKLSLDFKSQALDSSRGFRITYKTFCNPIELTGFQGVIESPGYPNGYQAHSQCGWTIRAPLGSNLSLAIADLDLEDSSGDYSTVDFPISGRSKQNSSSTYFINKCRDDFVEIFSIFPPAIRQNGTKNNITAIIESQQVALVSRESKKFKSKVPKFGKRNSVLCGQLSNIPESERIIILDTNLVYVNFESDRSVESRGFRIEWKAEGCSGVPEIKTDSVSSVSYHEQMSIQDEPTECFWIIDFSKQFGRMELTVDADMRIPDASKGFIGDVCEDASFIIYDGLTDKSPILIKNCDSQNKRESLISSSSQVLVRFFTSGQHNYGRGFVLSAYPTRLSSCLSSDFDLRSPFNQVAIVKKSPKYPDLYDSGPYNCIGLVTAQRNSRIKFNIDELDIPISDSSVENSDTGMATTGSGLIDPDTCKKSNNYFMISTSSSKKGEEVYCGKLDLTKEKDLARSSVVFEEATAWEQFVAQAGFRGRWQISYTRLCGSSIWIEGQREFITPNYPLRPNWPKPAGEDELDRSENVCIWALKTGNNRVQGKLYLNIINFIESDNKKRSNMDCLRVYEGVELDLKRSQFNLTDIDSKLTARLKICKQSDLKYSSLQYTSQSSELYIVISGNVIVKFQVKPFENGCGGEYHLKKSEFASLGYPQPYTELLDCHYFIKSSPGSKINLKFLTFALPEGETSVAEDGESTSSDSKCDNVDYVEIRQISISKKLNLKLNPVTSSFRLGIWSDLGFFLEQMNKRKNVTNFMKTSNTNATTQLVLSQTLTPEKQRLFDIAKTYYLFEELYNSELSSMRFSTIRTSYLSLDSFYENSKLIGRYCGNKKPNLNNLQFFDEVLVRFRSHGKLPTSDSSLNKRPGVAPKGFLAEYEIEYGGLIQVTDKETMDGGGFISSPSYPIKTRYNNSIMWTFETKLDSILQFDLINLDLGSSHLDCGDSLKIYDGLNVETSIRLSRACGYLKFKSLQYFRSRLQAKPTPLSSSVMLNVNALPLYEALDPKVKSNLIRSVRTSSNVATIVYDNYKIEGSFLLRYKAINKLLAKEQRDSRNKSEDISIIDENDVILEEKQDSLYNPNDLVRQNASKLCSNTYQLNIYDNFGGGKSNRSTNSSNQVTLLSPNYPNEPGRAIECHWLIYTPDDTVISLSIDLINISNSSDDDRTSYEREDRDECFDSSRGTNSHQSHITIHDGASRLSPIAARFCLPAPPKQVTSSGRHMLIRYVYPKFSQSSDIGIVQSAAASPIEPRHFLFRGRASVGQCGGQYHITSFSIITDRPQNSSPFYANNLNCKYYIFAGSQDKVLTIYNSQSEIDLSKEPSNENCTVGDYIEIRDLPIQSEVLEFSPQLSQGRLLGRFCAGRKLETIESPNSAISIVFKTDNQNTAKGWSLGIISGDPYMTCPFGRKLIKMDEPFGLFTSPNWPHGLNRERHCQYGFVAPTNQSILVSFIRLNRPLLGEIGDIWGPTTHMRNNRCADNFDYLDDNEASLSYRFSSLRELNSPISGSLLRDHIQQIPCTTSLFKRDKFDSESKGASREESNITPEELSNLLKIEKPGLKKLTSDEYYQLLQKASENFFQIKTNSHTLLMDYQTKSLLPKEGFVAVYRTDDNRKFNCGGELSYSEASRTSNSKPSNYFESANFNQETQLNDDFIQCDWSIEAQPEKFSQYDRSLAVGISYSMVPTIYLGNTSNTYIVFQALEIPSMKPEKSLFDDNLEPSEKEKLNEYCGLNRLILIDNWSAWPSLIACGNLTNARKWHMLSYGDRKLSIRTKNLRYKQEKQSGNDLTIYRGVKGYLYEKNCLQVERIIGEGIRLRSNRDFPNSSYTPGICRWRLRLDGGNYKLSFDRVEFRPPENYSNKTGMVCDTNDPDLDYIEIRASESGDSPILARYCIYNQMKEKDLTKMINMESHLVVTFVAGVKQLSLGSETFNDSSPSISSVNQQGIKKQVYGFDMEIVRISNESISEFCRRDKRESIYWFIRSYASYYYDTFMPLNVNFLYPKNVDCFVDISIEKGMQFNMTFRGVFDIEPSKDCKNDYIQIDDLISSPSENSIDSTTTADMESGKTHMAFKNRLEPAIKRIGKWCGRTKPDGWFASTSNNIRITFHSNNRIEGKGFTLVYSRSDGTNNNTSIEAKTNEYIYL